MDCVLSNEDLICIINDHGRELFLHFLENVAVPSFYTGCVAHQCMKENESSHIEIMISVNFGEFCTSKYFLLSFISDSGARAIVTTQPKTQATYIPQEKS